MNTPQASWQKEYFKQSKKKNYQGNGRQHAGKSTEANE
jgi:hypothetical protein